MIIDIDSKEGSRILTPREPNKYFEPEVETTVCQKGWNNQINNGSRIMPKSCPLTPSYYKVC
jgi:hypothetical protein